MAAGYFFFDSDSRFIGSLPLSATPEELEVRLGEFELRAMRVRSNDPIEAAFRGSEENALSLADKYAVSDPSTAAKIWRIIGDRRYMEQRRSESQPAYQKSLSLATNDLDRGVALIRLASIETGADRFVYDEMIAQFALEGETSSIRRIAKSFLTAERARFGSLFTTEFNWCKNDDLR
jgi:hypothetical protein